MSFDDDDIRRLNLQRLMKNEGSTFVLSLIFGFFGLLGIGHIYIGRTGKGVALLVLGLVLLVLGILLAVFLIGIFFLIIYLVIFIYQTVDARDNAKDFNDYLLKTKNNLW